MKLRNELEVQDIFVRDKVCVFHMKHPDTKIKRTKIKNTLCCNQRVHYHNARKK